MQGAWETKCFFHYYFVFYNIIMSIHARFVLIYLDVNVSFNYLFKMKFYVTTFVESALLLGIKIWKFSCRSLFKLPLKMAIISNNIEIYILIKLNLCFLLRFRHWGLRTKMTVKCELPGHILEAPGNDSNDKSRCRCNI